MTNNNSTPENHIPAPLNGCLYIHNQVVAWGDMDALGHLNNVMYYRYVESARINYALTFDMFKNVLTFVAKSSCSYLKPVVFPDTLQIGVKFKKVGNSSLTVEYLFFSEQQQCLVAISEAIVVRVSDDGKASKAWSEAERQSLLERCTSE